MTLTPKPLGRCDIHVYGLYQLVQLWFRMSVIWVDFILESIFKIGPYFMKIQLNPFSISHLANCKTGQVHIFTFWLGMHVIFKDFILDPIIRIHQKFPFLILFG